MNMKEAILQDLSIFVNIDEFAELHEVNGQTIPVVIDADITKKRLRYRDESYDGVYSGQVVVYVKSADLPGVPAIGSVFRLDGKMYLVANASNEMGILEITLEANET